MLVYLDAVLGWWWTVMLVLDGCGKQTYGIPMIAQQQGVLRLWEGITEAEQEKTKVNLEMQGSRQGEL